MTRKVWLPVQLIFKPMEARISMMRLTSSILGMADKMVFPLIMGRAQRMATAEFLAELVLIVPYNFRPPLMIKFDICFIIP